MAALSPAHAQLNDGMPPDWANHKIIPATDTLCQQSCDSDTACKGWARDDNSCRLYAETINRKPSAGWDGWGLRSTPFPTAEDIDARRATYAADKAPVAETVIHGFDIAGYILAKGEQAPRCAAICQGEASCKAWTYIAPKDNDPPACWTKFAVGPRVPYAGHITGLREDAPPPLAQVVAKVARLARPGAEVIELHRPRIVARTLNADEKLAASRLAAAYRSSPSWTTLDQLWLLAESGDRDAMKLVLQAGQAPKDAPFENRDLTDVARTLHAIWGAQYWNLHGPDRDAALALNEAFWGNTAPSYGGTYGTNMRWDAGFTVTYGAQASDKTGFLAFANSGKTPPIATFSFHTARTRGETDKQRFEGLLAQLGRGSRVWGGDVSFMDDYARANGLQTALQQALANLPAAEAAANAQRDAQYRDQILKRWLALLPSDFVSAQTPYATLEQLEPLAAALGGERLESLAKVYSFKRSSTAEKLCAQGSPSCAAQRDNAAKAEMAARISARQAAGLGGTGLVTQPSGSVQVRTYDQNGNYTGTTTMSGLEAEILGAKPY